MTYYVTSVKSAGKVNGGNVKRHYELNDFSYMIVEVGGTRDEPEKYKGNFCILPIRVLLENNILKTDTCKGKKGFYVCPPDYPKEHWSKKY